MDFNDLMIKARQRLLDETEITSFSPGSIARTLLEIYNTELIDLQTYLDFRFSQMFVDQASGNFLDNIGKLFGLSRKDSSYAMGDVKFYIDPATGKTLEDLKQLVAQETGVVEDIIIPEGTRVTSEDGTIVYKTVEDATLADDGVSVSVLAILPGADSNVSSNELTKWEPEAIEYLPINDLVLVTNPAPIDTGEDIEDDNNFRYRIVNATKSAAKANEMAVRLACLSVPGVSDVMIRNYEYGIGTFGVYIISESPIISDGILKAAQEAINNVQSLGIRGIATPPDYKSCGMNIVLEFYPNTPAGDKDNIVNSAVEIVIGYVNNIPLGQPLIYNEMIQRIMDISDKIKDVNIKDFRIGDYDIETGSLENETTVLNKNQYIEPTEKWVTNKILVTGCYV